VIGFNGLQSGETEVFLKVVEAIAPRDLAETENALFAQTETAELLSSLQSCGRVKMLKKAANRLCLI
jgi:hypothetical protein